MNENAVYPGIVNHFKNSQYVITEQNLETLNYLQRNKYEINSEFLNYILENFHEAVRLRLQNFPNANCFVENIHFLNQTETKLRSFDSYLENNTDMNKLKQKLVEASDKKCLVKQIARLYKQLYQEYLQTANEFFNFVNTIVIAIHYKLYKFFFSVFLDSRGRIYYKTTGTSFGLQTGDFSRCLISLCENEDIRASLPRQTSEYEIYYEDYLKSIDKKKQPFQ